MTPTSSAIAVIRTLAKRYTKKGDLDFGSPEDTLLATLMSARTTDVQVLKVYPGFRKKFPTWASLAKADVSAIVKTISSIGLYQAKAKASKSLAQKMLRDFDGKVPSTLEELITLPGVGRKTASCVLTYAFNVPAIAVDTHVFRIARRLGWSKGKTPEQVERDLMTLVPRRLWNQINRTMVQFGREICVGGTPRCWTCPIAKWCAYTPKTAAPVKENRRQKTEGRMTNVYD